MSLFFIIAVSSLGVINAEDTAIIEEYASIENDDSNLTSSDGDVLGSITPTVEISDSNHPSSVNNVDKGTKVTIDVKATADFSHHYDYKVAKFYVNNQEISSTNLLVYNYDDNDRRGSFDYTFNSDGTYVLKVVLQAYQGYSETFNEATSNTITYIVGGVNNTPEQNVSASLIIYDINNKDNSTIYTNGNYFTDIYYTLNKSGSFNDEYFEVYINDNYKGRVNITSQNRIGNLTIPDDTEFELYVIYNAKVNNDLFTSKSNSIFYKYKPSNNSTSEVNNTNVSLSLRIYDINYPDNNTIYINNNYNVDLYYILNKSGVFTDENIEIFVNNISQGKVNLNTENKLLINVGIDENYEFYAIYRAFVDDKEYNITSNTINYKFINSTNSSEDNNFTNNNTNQSNSYTLIIRDVNHVNESLISISSNYSLIMEYYIELPSNDLITSSITFYCNNEPIKSISFPENKVYTNIGELILINQTGLYNISVSYNGWVFGGNTYNFTGNSIIYDVIISNNGTGNVTNSTGNVTNATGNFTNSTGNDSKSTPNISLNTSVNENNVNITINLPSDAVGNVTVKINDNEYSATVSKGIAEVLIYNLNNNVYYYNVTYSGDSKYLNVVDYGNFSIDVQSLSKIDTLISINKTVIYYGGDLTIHFVDINKNSLYNKILTVVIDDELQYEPVDDGVVIISDLSIGNHKLIVSFNGDDEYNSYSISSNISVISSIQASGVVRAYNTGCDFNATFFDINGRILSNSEVVFSINGNDYLVNTNSRGIGVLNIPLAIGKYNVVVTNPINNEKITSNIRIVNRFSSSNVVMDYSTSSSFKVRIFDDNGNPVGAGEIVSIKIGSKTYKVKTDKNSYAKCSITNIYTPNTYSIITTYKGFKLSNKLTVKQVLKASNKKFKKNNSKSFSAILKSSKGKAIIGKKITFKFNGKKYTAKTNKKGVATIKIKKFTKLGKFIITSTYLKTTIKNKITITK